MSAKGLLVSAFCRDTTKADLDLRDSDVLPEAIPLSTLCMGRGGEGSPVGVVLGSGWEDAPDKA